ncbi:phage baseplate protein [Dietzia maris]|uniref:phage baseplate protein n=1 Tax=Dietzia maris TaxID=37915 RepID=UPI0037CAEC86
MADKRITDLPELPQADSGDFIPIVDSSMNVTKKVSFTGLLSRIWPVGSIYYNATDSTNPASLLGFGTWEVFGAGRVPVGFDVGDNDFNAAEKTGGSKEMQSHSHPINRWQPGSGNWGPNNKMAGTNDNGAAISVQGSTASAGSGNSGNLQPYIVVYMWKRTA